MSNLLNGSKILAARDRKTKEVDVPEWGGSVLIAVMGALDRARFGDWINEVELKRKATAVEEYSVDEDEANRPGTIVTTDSPDGQAETVPGETGEDVGGEVPVAEPTIASTGQRAFTRTDDVEAMLRYLIACIVDPETFEPAFTLDQLEALGRKDPAPLNRLYEAALELNLDTKAAIEDAAKNSETTAPGGSGGG